MILILIDVGDCDGEVRDMYDRVVRWWQGGHRGRFILVAVRRGSGATGKDSRRCCWTPCS